MPDEPNSGNGVITGATSGGQSSQAVVSHNLINEDWLAELTLDEAEANAALVTGCATKLNAEGIAQLFAQDMRAQVQQERSLAGAIEMARSNRTGAMGNEDKARLKLIKVCGPIQCAAKRKFARKQKSLLKLCAAGEGVGLYNVMRTQPLVAIPILIQTAKDDALAGASNTKTNAVQAAFDAWNNFDATQTTAGTMAHEQLKEFFSAPVQRLSSPIGATCNILLIAHSRRAKISPFAANPNCRINAISRETWL